MEFGVFDHLDRSDGSLSELYEQRLRIAELYDRAGFYAYHLAEHHATPLGMAPSPGIFLAALAQRTRRLRFGPLVYLLPLYHPLRIAEEIAMLDQLSGGRLEIGIGRGRSPIEVGLYGYDFDETQSLFEEVLAVLEASFRGGEITYAGRHFDFAGVPVVLRPLQEPHPPLWYGVASVESALRCAREGINVVTLTRPETAARLVRAFREAAAEAGRPQLKAGVARFVVVGETDEEALRVARRAYRLWHASFHRLFKVSGTLPAQGERPAAFEEMLASGLAFAGAPERVAGAIRAELAACGANYFVGQFVFGDMTLAEATASISAFAGRVIPALRATPAAGT